jgi:WD repeat-containing protein 70
MPKSFGKRPSDKKKKHEPKMPSPVVADDEEYEVESLDDDPLMAMMPMSFGKQDRKKDLTATFAKTKRVVSALSGHPNLKEEKPKPELTVNPLQESGNENEKDEDGDDSDDMIGPMPAEAEMSDEQGEDEDEFPISHELVLRDHTKASPPLSSSLY